MRNTVFKITEDDQERIWFLADVPGLRCYRGALFCLVFFLLLIVNCAVGQQGKPFISNYPPISYSSNVYNSSPQNWCIEKDVSGKIVVANTSGILVYDGVEWKMVSGTENKLLFKLAKDVSGKIYTGGKGEIGYLKANEKGELLYISLLDKLSEQDRDFGRILCVVAFKGEVYFRSKSHLFRYSEGSFKTWRPDDKFIKLVSSSAGLFITGKNNWYKIEGDSLHTIATKNSRSAGPRYLQAVFKGPGDTLLVVSRTQGLFYLFDGRLVALSTNLENTTIWEGCELLGDRFALSTDVKGIIIVDSKGKVLNVIDEATGLNSSGTIFPYYSSSELWVGMHSGISKIEYPSNLSYLNKENGLKGIALSIARYNDRLFVGTMEGAFWLDQLNLRSSSSFTPFEDELKGVFDAIQLDDKLIIANSNGLFVVSEKKRYKVEGLIGEACSAITNSDRHKNLVYTGYGSRVVPVRINEDINSIIHNAAMLPHMVYSLAETKNGNLWAAYNGISYIDYSKGIDNPKVTTLDSHNGLKEEMGFMEVTSINGKILFGTEIGLYTYDHKKKKLVKDYMFGKEFCDGSHMAFNLTETRNGDVWITTGNQTGLLRKQMNNTFIYDSLLTIRAPVSDIWGIYEDDDNVVWICGTEAVVRYDPKVDFDYYIPYKAFVRGVIINDKKKIFAGNYSDADGNPSVNQPSSYIPTLEYTENNITFQYGAAYYSTDQKLDYSIKLEGKDLNWSSWRKATEINYTNLPAGKYTFRARSRNVYGNISEEASYSFVILRPFWLKWWFVMLEFLFGIGIIISLVRLRLKIVDRRHAEKEKMMQLQQEAMTQQMNPHFIFNALGSVQNSILKGNSKQANSYLVKFSRLLRSGLNASRSQLITLQDDKELMENYLAVEKIRLGDNFSFNVELISSCENYSLYISPFLLQPFIENAIKHGIGENHEAGYVHVTYTEKDNCIECSIEDNGIGRDAASDNNIPDHLSHGTKIAFERIELFNKSRDCVCEKRIEDLYDESNTPSGTRVVFTLPIIKNV